MVSDLIIYKVKVWDHRVATQYTLIWSALTHIQPHFHNMYLFGYMEPEEGQSIPRELNITL